MIYLSQAHGVNPAMECCFFCNEPRGVALLGKFTRHKAEKMFGKELAATLPGNSEDVEAPRNVVVDRAPCESCRGHMEAGIILISVDEKKTADKNNPYRTGGWCVIKDETIRRVVHPAELRDTILKARMAFVPDEDWEMLGLPRGEMKP